MSKISKAFENGKAFIGFITCGDPDLETTKQIIKQMAQNGADLIELGIPFSDPVAEGPIIQGANIRALANGITTDNIFDMAKQVRAEVSVPMVFMTYANVVFSYGTERFAEKCREIGMDGVILPDIPFEEKDEFAAVFKKYGLDFISLVAPTSDNRIEQIASDADGFIYCVSSLGVTGVRKSLSESAGEIVKQVKKYTDKPAAIGFGISTPEQACEMAQFADGIIVGSAIVRIVAEHGKDSPRFVGEYVREMKAALKNI